MVQGRVGSGGQERVSLAEVLAAVPQALVDETVEVCGVADGGPDGGLPPYLTACLAMASCLLPEDGPEELVEKVIAALPQFGVRDAGWGPLTPSGIAGARERLGRDVLRETSHRVAVVECGSHAVVDAEVGPRTRSGTATAGGRSG